MELKEKREVPKGGNLIDFIQTKRKKKWLELVEKIESFEKIEDIKANSHKDSENRGTEAELGREDTASADLEFEVENADQEESSPPPDLDALAREAKKDSEYINALLDSLAVLAKLESNDSRNTIGLLDYEYTMKIQGNADGK